MKSPAKRVLFIGDSITAQFPLKELLTGYAVVNKGISGDNTDLVLARLDRDVIALRPVCVFIMIGTNDMASLFPDSKILANYDLLLRRMKDGLPNVKLCVQSILPTRNLENRPLERIRSLNVEIHEIAHIYGARFLDLTKLFANERGELSEKFSDDGLHLTAGAYKKWAEYLKEILPSCV
jgi:lysophospholipase L1-like esterase